MSDKALVLVDLQNDYFPGGAMALEGSPEAVGRARTLLDAFRARGLPVVHVQHLSVRPGASFFVPGTPGVEIHEAVRPLEGEPVVQKHFPNAFRQTALLERLHGHGLGGLVIAGMMTHMCIDATTRAAFDLGFECAVAEDACATRSLAFGGRSVAAADVHAAFLAALDGLYAKVQPVDAIVAAL